jgi:NADH:ubiquinone oxidoreductase subunit F (NADH-binding)
VTPPASSSALRHAASGGPTRPGPTGVDRLLRGVGPDGGPSALADHLDRFGPLPSWKGRSFLDELDTSGLRGHGGAWFPAATKWRSLRRSLLRGPVVVANGAESEPASGKDRILLERVPHLVLDGAVVAAQTLGASQIYVYVPPASAPGVRRAIDERFRLGLDGYTFEVVVAPDRFLAGQETAVVNAIIGRRPATPTFAGVRTIREQGVGGRPTLVQNVESLAHVALIARYGAAWFRTAGTTECPGTALLTVTGRWSEPRVIEVPLGSPLASAVQLGPDEAREIQGVLLGGYGGGWLTTAEAMSLPLTEDGARQVGSTIGAGVVALLPAATCPLAEVSRVVRYLESEGAGQCGPCVNGLAALADAVGQLAARPSALRGGISSIPALCGLVEGRGACRHPDGVARFVRSALRVFDGHVSLHLQRGPCRAGPEPFLPLPRSARKLARP